MRYFLLPFFLVFTIFNVHAHVEEAPNKATVTGYVKNITKHEINFMEYGLPFNLDAERKIPVHKDGNFKIELKMDAAQYYYVIYNRVAQIIYLNPGDDLHIEFDGYQMINTITYEGSAKAVNDFLKIRLANDKATQGMINFQNKQYGLYLQKWEEYQKQVKNNKSKQEAALQQFSSTQKSNKKIKQFIKYEEANIAGTQALFYMQYPAHHGHFTRQPSIGFWKNVDFKTVEALKNRANKDLLMSKPYRDFLNQYALAMAEKIFLEKNVKLNSRAHFVSESYFKVDELFSHQWQKDYVKSRLLYEFINQNGIGEMEAAMENYQQLPMPKTYQKAVEKVWNKWGSTKPGAKAPEIIGQDVNGNEVKLSDFKGKVVYIDVWATWCGPCRQQIPFLKETEARFHGKDVVFLSVSTDNDKKKWKDYVKKHNLTGVQIHNPGGWGSDICKKYNITGIPRFMLIDKEGKIITVQAHRPSQGIDGILEKHLAK